MPLAGIRCAAPKYKSRDAIHEVSVQECLDCAASRTNDCSYTYEILKLMYDNVQDREANISTTTLTSKCLRSEFLKRAEDYTESPDKMWASFRGTMLHGQLEGAARPKSIAEARFHVDIPGLGHLSGSPDLLDVAEGILYDYKTCKEVPRFNYPWGDHKDQCNVNRWLVDHADYVEWQGKEWEPEMFRPVEWQALVLVYIDNNGVKPLDVTKSEKVPTVDGKGTKSVRVPDIWSDDEALEWITERYVAVQGAFHHGQLPDIPEDFQGWEHPLCGFCPKRKECTEAYYRDNPVTTEKTYAITRPGRRS